MIFVKLSILNKNLFGKDSRSLHSPMDYGGDWDKSLLCGVFETFNIG